MPDILHDFVVAAPVHSVFRLVTEPQGLDRWWTRRSSGHAELDAVYVLWFGPEYDWRARVTACVPGRAFELEIVAATPDWVGTRVGFDLEEGDGVTHARFHHTGWPEANEHFRISSYCWAMYLRILRRHLEHGEAVPYEARLSV